MTRPFLYTFLLCKIVPFWGGCGTLLYGSAPLNSVFWSPTTADRAMMDSWILWILTKSGERREGWLFSGKQQNVGFVDFADFVCFEFPTKILNHFSLTFPHSYFPPLRAARGSSTHVAYTRSGQIAPISPNTTTELPYPSPNKNRNGAPSPPSK